jgi:hypothetical protein
MSLLADERTALFDEFLNSYVSWREACDDVWDTYRRWTECEPEERSFAFACYRAALDREDRAAHMHGDRAQQLSAHGSGTARRAA